MRYYVYVSETKVDQLYAQIPTRLRHNIAVRLTIDLKLIRAEFEGKQTQESLFSKLDIVLKYLEERDLIGTMDNPRDFFAHTMPLSWGFYGSEFPEQTSLVYFGGSAEQTVLGMGGSARHVIGEAGKSYTHSASNTPMLITALTEALSESVTEPYIYAEWHLLKRAGEQHFRRKGASLDPKWILDAVQIASGQWPPLESMEFVAVQLVSGVTEWVLSDGKWKYQEPIKVILGTPLYVARRIEH